MSAAYGPLQAQPYPWPFDGTFTPESTALLCIDWQADFCGKGGYVDLMGYDLALTRAGLEPTARTLAAMRERGFTVVHTREGHRPDLADCPPNKLRGSAADHCGLRIVRLHASAKRAAREPSSRRRCRAHWQDQLGSIRHRPVRHAKPLWRM